MCSLCCPNIFMGLDRRARRQGGFALIIVLWSLVLLALIVTQLLAAARGEMQVMSNMRSAVLAESAADGAVHQALFHLLSTGPQHWPARGVHPMRSGEGEVTVTLDDLSGKINPNNARLPLLSAIIELCGRSVSQAAELAQAIMTWRGMSGDEDDKTVATYREAGLGYIPPGLPIETLEELALVVGMTRPTLTCLLPHLSLYQGSDPNPDTADALVSRAITMASEHGYAPVTAEDAANVVQITATARVPGARFTRQATAELVAKAGQKSFHILLWAAPAASNP